MGRLLAPDEQLGPMFKVFYGRMYINVSQMRRVASLGGAPAANMGLFTSVGTLLCCALPALFVTFGMKC